MPGLRLFHVSKIGPSARNKKANPHAVHIGNSRSLSILLAESFSHFVQNTTVPPPHYMQNFTMAKN